MIVNDKSYEHNQQFSVLISYICTLSRNNVYGFYNFSLLFVLIRFIEM